MSKRFGKRQKKAAPGANRSKRRQFSEFFGKILDALKREGGFQEAEELIAELRGGAGGYLSALVRQVEEAGAKERLDLLSIVSHLEDQQAVPHLEHLIFESPIDVAAKRRSAEILDQLSVPLEVGMAESLRNAEAILEGVPNLKPESFHGSHPLFVKFVQLPPVLRQATLIDLAASDPGMAMNFVELLRSRESSLHPETIEALVLMEDPRAAKVLEEYLESSKDKQTTRDIRRALYRLNSRGVAVGEGDPRPKPESQGIFRPVIVPPQGFMSVVDGSGTRVVWLAKPVSGSGRLLFQAIANDERGLLDFSTIEVSLRSFRSYMEEVTTRDKDFPVAEVPAAYAASIMDAAYRLSQERKEEIPQEFPIHQRQISELVGEDKPDLKEMIDESGGSGAGEISAEDMKALLKRPEFAGWVVGEDKIAPFVEEVKSVLDSQLVVSRGTRQDQVDDICGKATAALFDRQGVERLVRQLEDTAYVLWAAKRKDVGQTTMAVAESLRNFEGDSGSHPFVDEMVRRSVVRFMASQGPEDLEEAPAPRETEEAQGDEPSLILTPDEARREHIERMTQRRSETGGGASIITPR